MWYCPSDIRVYVLCRPRNTIFEQKEYRVYAKHYRSLGPRSHSRNMALVLLLASAYGKPM